MAHLVLIFEECIAKKNTEISQTLLTDKFFEKFELF
jgi:hypothetical protein